MSKPLAEFLPELVAAIEADKHRAVHPHEVLANLAPESLAFWKAAPTRDEAQHANVDTAPPDACWLCWKSLGVTESCPMCALKRQEDAP